MEFPVQLNTGAYDNWVKFMFNTSQEGESTTFVFYFLWENLSDYYAVVNVATPVTLNGICGVGGAPGVFRGTMGYLQLETQLSPIQYWIQPPTAASGQPSAVQVPFDGSADGGGLIGSNYVSYVPQSFDYKTYQHSYDLFLVPPASVALFEVSLAVIYSFSDGGGNPEEGMTVDFLSNDGSVSCPFVLLQLLTPPA